MSVAPSLGSLHTIPGVNLYKKEEEKRNKKRKETQNREQISVFIIPVGKPYPSLQNQEIVTKTETDSCFLTLHDEAASIKS